MIDHVVTRPTAPFTTGDGRLEIHQVPAWQDNLIWIAVCTQTGAAAVVDGPEAGGTLEYCAQEGITLSTVFNMGGMLFNSGDKAAAKPFFVRAAKGFAKSLGPAHPQTIQAQKVLQKCG